MSFVIEMPPQIKFVAKSLKLNGVTISERNRMGLIQFVLTLKNVSESGIFVRLCQDLSDVKKTGADQKYADDISLRLEQWVHFLSKSRRNEIMLKTQMGLFGELEFLKTLMSNGFSLNDALKCWRGPDGNAHDFVFAGYANEVKAKMPEDKTVTISSEGQLDAAGVGNLGLSVFELAESATGKTIAEAATEMIAAHMTDDADLRAIFERKLLSLNFNIMESYDNLMRFESIGMKHYSITDKFPKLVASTLPVGVLGVKYKLNLDAISEFATSFDPSVLK